MLAAIRNRSLDIAQQEETDYYFVVDCDNFIAPCTLKELIKESKPIIAPMLRAVPKQYDCYSNFFSDVDQNGYFKNNPEYYQILSRQKVGTFKTPVVHCTYLIKSDYIKDLGYIDQTDDYEFVIFSRNARKEGIDQYICNKREFGVLLHFGEKITLEQEAEEISKLFPKQNLVE